MRKVQSGFSGENFKWDIFNSEKLYFSFIHVIERLQSNKNKAELNSKLSIEICIFICKYFLIVCKHVNPFFF